MLITMAVDDPTTAKAPAEGQQMGSIAAEVWRISWPAMAMNILQTINMFVDRGIIGNYLKKDALAAVAVSGQLMFLIISMAFALSTGTTALVARFYGADEMADARQAARQSIALSIILGAAGTAIGFALMQPFLNAMDLESSTRAASHTYLFYILFGIFPTFVINAISGSFRGIGDTVRPMVVMAAVNVTHIICTVLLVTGIGGLPQFGLAGAAIALLLSQVVGLALFIASFSRYGIKGALRLTWPDIGWAKRILRISIPASLQAFLRVSAMMAFTAIIARTPDRTAALAALQIGIIAESIAFMPGLGYMVAASALVGINLGAKRPERAEKLGWAAGNQCAVLMAVLGAGFFIFAEPLARLFGNDPQVTAIAVSYLRIMAITEPLLAYAMVLAGAVQGAGDTVRPTMVTLITMWGFRVPAAYFLAVMVDGGTRGAWWAMSISQAFGGVIMVLVFRQGRWKFVRV